MACFRLLHLAVPVATDTTFLLEALHCSADDISKRNYVNKQIYTLSNKLFTMNEQK